MKRNLRLLPPPALEIHKICAKGNLIKESINTSAKAKQAMRECHGSQTINFEVLTRPKYD